MDQEQEAKDLRELQAAKSEKDRLIRDGEKTLKEFTSLLGQLSLSSSDARSASAAREKNNRVAALNARLDAIKKDIEESEVKESEAELKVLETNTKKKTQEIKRAIKEKEIQTVLRTVSAAESVPHPCSHTSRQSRKISVRL
jgi:hypothetical protein